MKQELKEIDISKIVANKEQPRTSFDEEKINELASSIEQNGLLQPITVVRDKFKYKIIAGERRFRACQKIGLKKVTCIIKKVNTQNVDLLAIIENIQREDLSIIEEAIAFQKLIFNYGYTQTELAKKLGKSQSNIANKIRLLQLDQNVIEAIDQKEITERHGRALLALDKDKQQQLLKQIIEKKLNVVQTENIIAKPKPIKKSKPQTKVYSKNMKIALNTLNQSIKLIEKSGIEIEKIEDDQENQIIVTLIIKK